MPIMNSFGGLREQRYSIANNPASTGNYIVLYTTTSVQNYNVVAPKSYFNESTYNLTFISDTGYVKLNTTTSNIANNQTLFFPTVNQFSDIDMSGNYLFTGVSVWNTATSGSGAFPGITGTQLSHTSSNVSNINMSASIFKSTLNRAQVGTCDNSNVYVQSGVIVESNTSNAVVYAKKLDINIGYTVNFFSSADSVRDTSDNLYVCGYSGTTTSGQKYGYVYKLDSAGNMVFRSQFQACTHFERIVLSRDQSKFYIIGGATYEYNGVGSPTYYQDGPPSGSNRPGYIIMGNATTGAITRQLSLPGDGTYGYYPTAIYVGADDNVYIAGTIYNYNWDVAGQIDYSYGFMMIMDTNIAAVSFSRMLKFESTITGYGTVTDTNYLKDIMVDNVNSHILITGSTIATYSGGTPANEKKNPFLLRLATDGTGTGTYTFTYRTFTYSSISISPSVVGLAVITPAYTLTNISDTITASTANATLTAEIAVSQKVNI